MEEAAELANYLPLSVKSPCLRQAGEGAGVHCLPVGRLRYQLYPWQISVRLSHLPPAHDELLSTSTSGKSSRRGPLTSRRC